MATEVAWVTFMDFIGPHIGMCTEVGISCINEAGMPCTSLPMYSVILAGSWCWKRFLELGAVSSATEV